MSDLKAEVLRVYTLLQKEKDESAHRIASAISKEMEDFHKRTGMHVGAVNVSIATHKSKGSTDLTIVQEVTVETEMADYP